jgi:hypothetical protein
MEGIAHSFGRIGGMAKEEFAHDKSTLVCLKIWRAENSSLFEAILEALLYFEVLAILENKGYRRVCLQL